MGRPKKVLASEGPKIEISEISEAKSEISDNEDAKSEISETLTELLEKRNAEIKKQKEAKPKAVRKPRIAKKPTQHSNPYSEGTYVLVPAGSVPKLKIGETIVWNELDCEEIV